MKGYYVIDKNGLFTDSSPYRYRESAETEAREIHGNDYINFIEWHLTDVFDENYPH